MRTRRALICGVTGQDGAYLAHFLLEKGYEVWGTSRDAHLLNDKNLRSLNVLNRLRLVSMAPNDFRSVLTALDKSDPDEVYYLCGQSSVSLSFEQPAETIDSMVPGILNLLECTRMRKRPCKIYHAGSSECFGDTQGKQATEDTPFKPASPYAVAKASSHWLIANYRDAYGIFSCTGILFNHESPLRPNRFVTQKIIQSVNKIADGCQEFLQLGRLDIFRDWGWAPDYVEAMWLMLQADVADDYVIATGRSISLTDFVTIAFNCRGLDWRDHVQSSEGLYRPSDVGYSGGDSSKARERLGWRPNVPVEQIILRMIDADIARRTGLANT